MPAHTARLSIFYYLTIIIIAIAVLSIAVLAGYSYIGSRDRMIALELMNQSHSESLLTVQHQTIDRDLSIFDALYNERMREAFPRVIEEYERSGKNPFRMDLASLRQELGGQYDLYVIDSSGVIIATTYKDELGFDLSTYPGFLETLTAMRLSGEFVPDRVVADSVDGTMRKYAYHSSPDNRYLFEISLTDSESFTNRSQFFEQEDLAHIQSVDPSLLSVAVYNVYGDPVSPTDTSPDSADKALIAEAVRTRSTVELTDALNRTISRYVFVDLKDPNYASDPSLVIAIDHSESQLRENLSLIRVEHTLMALLALVLGALFAVAAANLVAKPIRGLVGDIERIADGDLDHRLTDGGSAELWSLRVSMERLTTQLLEQLAAVRLSEQRVREQNEALELRVAERTRELAEANEEAHLYIDIMTHDLSGTLRASLALAGSMTSEVEGVSRERGKRLQETLLQGVRIIDEVARVERMSHLDQPLEEVALDRAIREGIGRYPDLQVRYDGTDERVLADGFLGEVFANLLGDSRYCGGSGVNCRIRVEPRHSEVQVTLEDDGPGLPARDQERLFARRARVGGDGPVEPALGLSIAGALVRRYGGRIWAEDRVGGYARGAMIHMRFRRMPSDTDSPADADSAG